MALTPSSLNARRLVTRILPKTANSFACATNRAMLRSQEIAIANHKRNEEEYHAVFNGDTVETTVENIRTLLRYLNDINWGVWQLPSMTIGYSCHQYDCDGKTATTIKLDRPIEYRGEKVTKFQYGAPSGHLRDYCRI